MATYKVKNIPGFEHLLVVGNEWQLDDRRGTFEVVEVKTFVNTSVVIGDRELKINLPDQAMFINIHNLELVPDAEAQREFAADNPYGEYRYEGRFTKGLLEIVHTVYEKAFTVSIIEKNPPEMKGLDKTIYSENFFSTRQQALDLIEQMLHSNLDPEDLIFELKELKESDTNG